MIFSYLKMLEASLWLSAIRGVAGIFRGVRTLENVRGAPKARADEGSGDMPPPRQRHFYFLGLGNAISHFFQGTVS